MVKEKEKDQKEKDNKLFVGVVWNCATEIKILLTALLFLSSLVIILQFLPSRFSLSSSDLQLCLSKLSSSTSTSTSEVPQVSVLSSSSSPLIQKDQIIQQGIIKRAFNSYGSAAYSFIQMGSYRGGLNTFAIIGLASKPLIVYGKPSYQCQWISDDDRNNNNNITTFGSKILPDWGYGRVYTVVVINCTFPIPVGINGSGGRLILHASDGGSGDTDVVVSTEKIEALVEAPGSLNASVFSSPPVYDYFYCGSPLYGDLSPQRVREWIAYHVKLFGEKSHFVIYDAGGIHSGVLEVLKPWIEKGYVTLQDVREQERFDGYYHNQFLVVNDCLHRYRFMAKWMFFFDVDEYIYVQPESTIQSIVNEYSGYTQFTIEQMPMSNKLCLASDAGNTERYTTYFYVAS
ncbi:hypothetical protein AQUCO_03000278v1 [Aquilegia coerulea]|uniref:Glycosyltransferase family 92 protein n=1 Tax=Aquilegia coerulea TaxID=218851 RepID=A0A2G5D278_AQUCA|nr:hypothetical protein AQUCO_03000278v1 [Aquilegia coerulea]